MGVIILHLVWKQPNKKLHHLIFSWCGSALNLLRERKDLLCLSQAYLAPGDSSSIQHGCWSEVLGLLCGPCSAPLALFPLSFLAWLQPRLSWWPNSTLVGRGWFRATGAGHRGSVLAGCLTAGLLRWWGFGPSRPLAALSSQSRRDEIRAGRWHLAQQQIMLKATQGCARLQALGSSWFRQLPTAAPRANLAIAWLGTSTASRGWGAFLAHRDSKLGQRWIHNHLCFQNVRSAWERGGKHTNRRYRINGDRNSSASLNFLAILTTREVWRGEWTTLPSLQQAVVPSSILWEMRMSKREARWYLNSWLSDSCRFASSPDRIYLLWLACSKSWASWSP